MGIKFVANIVNQMFEMATTVLILSNGRGKDISKKRKATKPAAHTGTSTKVVKLETHKVHKEDLAINGSTLLHGATDALEQKASGSGSQESKGTGRWGTK